MKISFYTVDDLPSFKYVFVSACKRCFVRVVLKNAKKAENAYSTFASNHALSEDIAEKSKLAFYPAQF